MMMAFHHIQRQKGSFKNGKKKLHAQCRMILLHSGHRSHLPSKTGSRVGLVVKAVAFYQYVPGSIPGPAVMWIKSVGSLLCSERFFSGFSGFLLSPKTNIRICSVAI